MQLELIHHPPRERTVARPVLFVHGAGGNADCWEHFLDYFAAAGCEAFALSLRGHGKSDRPRSIPLTGYNSYVQDIRSCVDRMPEQPIIVAHSWGGFILQHYLARHHDCPGAVLMASAPPTTSAPTYWRMAKLFPRLVAVAHLSARPHHIYSTARSIRALLYRPDTPDQEIDVALEQLERISTRLYFQTIFSSPEVGHVKTALLVLGAGNDAIYPPVVVSETADAYGCEAVVIPDMCHMMMRDPNWQRPADIILDWLRDGAGNRRAS